jgi:hypothetical protein
MIAKRIARKAAKADYGRLARYVLDMGTKERSDPKAWERLATYVLDDRDGGRVGMARVTNCQSDDLRWAIREIEATQAKNTRSKTDKDYHLVLSFPEGEQPTADQLRDIEEHIVKTIGFGDHQRISAVHTDTDNLHVHIAINKVHPRTYRNVEPYYDQPRLMEACAEMERRYGLKVDNHGKAVERRVHGGAEGIEQHGGRESLLGWVREHAGEDAKRAASAGTGWADMHQALARHGLEIRLRGSGLVIGPVGERLAVKASDVDRSMAFQRLTDKWGDYTPPEGQQQAPKPERRYQAGPKHKHEGTGELFTQYQREREAAQAARNTARAELDAAQAKYAKELAAWHKEQRAALRSSTHLGRGEKKAAYQKLAEQRRDDWIAKRTAIDAGRKSVAGSHPLPTWQAFLESAAAKGDVTALAALRSRQGRQARLAFDLLTAEDAASARQVVFHELNPRTKRNGDQVYNVRDGGQVTDRKAEVRVDQLTAGAAFLALSLAGDRFEGRDLVVQGSAEFKDQVVWLAGTRQLAVTFADPAMEAERARLAALREKPAQQKPEHATDALHAFVASRNAQRDKICSITYHRPWEPADAGPVEYQGRRKLSDGAEVVLLKRGEEMLVKPVTEAQAAKASTWKVGQEIETDNRGRFVTDSHRVKR